VWWLKKVDAYIGLNPESVTNFSAISGTNYLYSLSLHLFICTLWYWIKSSLSFSPLSAVLAFELRALCFLGRVSTTWLIPLALFCLSYFSARFSSFCPGPTSDHNPPASASHSWDYRHEPQPSRVSSSLRSLCSSDIRNSDRWICFLWCPSFPI
jgi:hypothetical protein